MEPHASQTERVSVDGKFLRAGASKLFVKGITYGPFAPDSAGDTFPSRDRTAQDFALLRLLGANVIRVYHVPPRWILDLALEHGLKVFVDIPWEKHRCFLETYEMRQAARQCVRAAAQSCQGHPALFAYSIANEVPAEIVRWHGARPVSAFLDDLVCEVKQVDPGALCTFASFPPTEYLQPALIDFLTFNVYLHERPAFESYLARLQTLANDKPLLLGEFGIDSVRETEARKCELLSWQIEAAFRAGLAGTVLFSFTDDWHRGGQEITDWGFGLTTKDRQPKASFAVVQAQYRTAPCFPLPRTPRVSVVVASYNGAPTLRACLESLTRLNYPDYEVILVDDGSTDNTQEIAAAFPTVRNVRQRNLGLSAARNAGISAASGEIIAFTDSDCRADEDWLRYLVDDLLRSEFAGIGGHNFLPRDDSPVAAAVLVSPGGPAHVMLTDREAEHIPGCNMAFYKWALDAIQGFDRIFRKAGDDVDVCWRLQERGYKVGFSPAGFVWHYRRSTVKAYLKQQAGYGEAEALLSQKHPEYFNIVGGGIWRGRIYSSAPPGIVLQRPVIYHGIFGSGLFQKLYAREPSFALMLCTSLPFHLVITLPLLALSGWFPALFPVAVAALLLSAGVCVAAAVQSPVPADKRRVWSRPLVALLNFLQPIVRGWARYKQRVNPPAPQAAGAAHTLDLPWAEMLSFWSHHDADRYRFLQQIQAHLERHGWPNKWDSGWSEFDLEVTVNRWNITRLTTASEDLAGGRKFIRCRVQSEWSWSSWIAGVAVFLGSLAIPLLIGERFPWSWMSLTGAALIWMLIEDKQRYPKAVVNSSITQVAAQLNLDAFGPAPARR